MTFLRNIEPPPNTQQLPLAFLRQRLVSFLASVGTATSKADKAFAFNRGGRPRCVATAELWFRGFCRFLALFKFLHDPFKDPVTPTASVVFRSLFVVGFPVRFFVL